MSGTVLQKKRRADIDFLRALAFFLIVLAHVGNVPTILLQLRNFDVVLMVIVMGMSYNLTGGGIESLEYIIKRFKRLIFPVWGFLIVYFLAASILKNTFSAFDFDLRDIIYSFILQTGIPGYVGIGYVWIFRVYFLMAIVAPLLKKISDKCSTKMCIITLIGLALVNEVVCLLCELLSQLSLGEIISQIIPYLTGYAVALFIGIMIDKLSRVQRLIIIFFYGVIFFSHILIFGIELTQTYKYPPRAYYLSYAIIASMICYTCTHIKVLKSLVQSKAIRWVSKNSLWLYLWHIIPLKLIASGVLTDKLDNFIARYIIVLSISVILVELHTLVKTAIMGAHIQKV